MKRPPERLRNAAARATAVAAAVVAVAARRFERDRCLLGCGAGHRHEARKRGNDRSDDQRRPSLHRRLLRTGQRNDGSLAGTPPAAARTSLGPMAVIELRMRKLVVGVLLAVAAITAGAASPSDGTDTCAVPPAAAPAGLPWPVVLQTNCGRFTVNTDGRVALQPRRSTAAGGRSPTGTCSSGAGTRRSGAPTAPFAAPARSAPSLSERTCSRSRTNTGPTRSCTSHASTVLSGTSPLASTRSPGRRRLSSSHRARTDADSTRDGPTEVAGGCSPPTPRYSRPLPTACSSS